MAQAFADGIGWGEAKQRLFERLDQEIAPMRAVYDELIQDPARIEQTLKMGAAKARAIATPFTQRLRHAVGLRALDARPEAQGAAAKAARTALPVFKQYREKDGLFYFKLTDAKGALLLQSRGFVAPREAAQAMVELAPAVVGDVNHVHAVRDGKRRVLCGGDTTLADDRHVVLLRDFVDLVDLQQRDGLDGRT